MTILDHYTGFEGYPELVFKSADNKLAVNVWDGYFDFILRAATTNEAGYWEGLALIYHTCTGWYENSPFEFTEVEIALRQLTNWFSTDWDSEIQSAYNDLLVLFEYAAKNRLAVIIDYWQFNYQAYLQRRI